MWQDGVWLRTALDRLLVRLGEPGADDAVAYEQLLGHLCEARDEGELFSLFPLALAGGHRERHGTTTQMLAEGTPC